MAEPTPHDEIVAELRYELPYSTIPDEEHARHVLAFLRAKLIAAYEKEHPEYITETEHATLAREYFLEAVEDVFGKESL